MKREFHASALALFTTLFMVLVTGCETVRPHQFQLFESYGGGGGEPQIMGDFNTEPVAPG